MATPDEREPSIWMAGRGRRARSAVRRGRRPVWVPIVQVHRCGRSGEPPVLRGGVRGCSSGRVTGTAAVGGLAIVGG